MVSGLVRKYSGHSQRRERNRGILTLAGYVMVQRRIEVHRGHKIADCTGRVAKISKRGTTKEISASQFRIKSDGFGLVLQRTLVVTLQQAHVSSCAPQRGRFRP